MQESIAAQTQLNTTLIDPLIQLEELVLAKRELIHEWFAKQWQLTMPPIYGSVDLRNAGFKVAPIDMNLFPAGFNNLNPDYMELATTAARTILNRIAPTAKTIGIIPENHTRNLLYWSNVNALKTIIERAGFKVCLGMLQLENVNENQMALQDGSKLSVAPIERKENELYIGDSKPDLIILNNDLSDGIPSVLQNIKQTLVPPAELGWSQRLKSEHFQYYAAVADEFSQLIGIDPWLIAPLFRHCGHVDFMQQDGMDCVSAHVEALFTEINAKYSEYNIPYKPFIIVKADSGTYGMAVMTVRSVDELKALNRKQRTRMSATKGGQPVTRVIIQEGIYSFETHGEDEVAEPVVYLWGSQVVGGFYRVHQSRGVDENLNAPGMHFEPIAFLKPCHEPCSDKGREIFQNRLFLYGIVASLSMLAAAREIKEIK